MSRIEFTRIVENYTFTPPSFISERDYDLLKTKTNLSREVPLYRNAKVEHAHNKLTALILVGFLAVILAIFGLVSSNEPPAWAIILLVISIFGVLHPLVNSGIFQSSINKVRMERTKVLYFNNLKNILNQAHNYEEFTENYSKIVY